MHAKHKKTVEVETEEEEEVHEKKTKSRFQWSHMADCIVENTNTQDETSICMLLAKEPWNADHG